MTDSIQGYQITFKVSNFLADGDAIVMEVTKDENTLVSVLIPAVQLIGVIEAAFSALLRLVKLRQEWKAREN